MTAHALIADADWRVVEEHLIAGSLPIVVGLAVAAQKFLEEFAFVAVVPLVAEEEVILIFLAGLLEDRLIEVAELLAAAGSILIRLKCCWARIGPTSRRQVVTVCS